MTTPLPSEDMIRRTGLLSIKSLPLAPVRAMAEMDAHAALYMRKPLQPPGSGFKPSLHESSTANTAAVYYTAWGFARTTSIRSSEMPVAPPHNARLNACRQVP